MKGTVKWYNIIEGRGSFKTDIGESVRFSRKVLPIGTFLDKGDNVEFDIVNSEKGPKAINVKKLQ
jgi:CspA family cold shock protein